MSVADLNAWQKIAVTRFHFNIRNGLGYTSDDEGIDLSSVKEARLEAIRGARSLLSAEVLEGSLDLNGQIEVTDDHQASVMTVRFVEAVDVHPLDQSGAAGR
jgi:hypothetical protein